MSDPDEDIQEQAFNVVRNLTESEDGIGMVFREIGIQVLGRITVGLNSGNDNVVLQVFFFFFFLFLKKNPLLNSITRQFPLSPTCQMDYLNTKI